MVRPSDLAACCALRISGDLERMGALAANIAKRTKDLARLTELPALHGLSSMTRLVQVMVKETLDAYVAGNEPKAHQVWRKDEKVNGI